MKLGKLKTPIKVKKNLTTGKVRDVNYIVADELPDEYDDVTGIENWNTYGLFALNDYLAVRKEIYNVFVDPAKGWANCTSAERNIVISYYVYKDTGDGAVNNEKAIHLITTGQNTPATVESALINYWNNFNEKNRVTLNARWFFVKGAVLKYLNIADAENLFETVKVLLGDMFLIGRLGIGYGLGGDNENGILNYVMSDEQFDETGMEHDGYILKTGTWADFKQDIKNILENGIYDKSTYNG